MFWVERFGEGCYVWNYLNMEQWTSSQSQCKKQVILAKDGEGVEGGGLYKPDFGPFFGGKGFFLAGMCQTQRTCCWWLMERWKLGMEKNCGRDLTQTQAYTKILSFITIQQINNWGRGVGESVKVGQDEGGCTLLFNRHHCCCCCWCSAAAHCTFGLASRAQWGSINHENNPKI